jgi:DNA-3-methyladenine glycosylase
MNTPLLPACSRHGGAPLLKTGGELKSMIYKKLDKSFYMQKCLAAAKGLIGKLLVRKKGKRVYSGIIVEAEAYTGSSDEASHAYRGMTPRNENMFREGGIAYVYFTYGNHYCCNVVVDKENTAHAVLIRALEPVEGISYMKKNRGTYDIYNLTSGPGKLTKAFEIDLRLNGADLRGDELFITEPPEHRLKGKLKYKTVKSKRIGINVNMDKLYRFYMADNPFVSRVNVKAILKKLTTPS